MAGQSRAYGSRPRRILLLNEADLEKLRSSADAAVYDRLRDTCRLYVRSRFGHGLSDEDCDDVIGNAIVDVYPLLESPAVAIEDADHELRKALERHRKRTQRRVARLVYSQRDVSIVSHADYVIARRYLLDVVELIEPYMRQALAALPQKDRDRVITAYGLHDPELGEVEPISSSSEAARKALSRALKRFNATLEQELAAALDQAGHERPALEDALAIVRGGAMAAALATARDLEK